MEDSEVYQCEHENKIIRKNNSDYTVNVCDNCFDEFNNTNTRPLFLAKQILTLSNNMIKKSPEFLNNSDKSIKLWHDCNNDVLDQLKKLNKSTSDNKKDPVEDETEYNFDEILHDTELDDNEQNLDGKNLHDLYRHSTKLIK
ncbi:hypothetical protein OAH75_03445 [Nitrosopumilus sp.]|nr:hypothetical protein [Nitrosopumilus sp.]MDB4840346.1 hypothetical protein [Nitrosopumilus sp.]